jgi:maleate cis-trans isomerase
LILPSGNAITEPEFYRVAPEGVTIHSTRVFLPRTTLEDAKAMLQDVEKATELLPANLVDAIGLGCGGGSFIGVGIEWHKTLSEQMRKKTGVPFMTTSMAYVEALKELGISKVAVVAPYNEELCMREREFLEGCGFKVVAIKGMGFVEFMDYTNCPLDIPYRLAHEVNSEEAEGIFISCTGWKTLPIIGRLENDLGKPVISSNQATFHSLLKLVGINDRIEGYGRLLSGQANVS